MHDHQGSDQALHEQPPRRTPQHGAHEALAPEAAVQHHQGSDQVPLETAPWGLIGSSNSGEPLLDQGSDQVAFQKHHFESPERLHQGSDQVSLPTAILEQLPAEQYCPFGFDPNTWFNHNYSQAGWTPLSDTNPDTTQQSQ